jgi:ATP/maltotriose-dependent transcriptional regulator MalT
VDLFVTSLEAEIRQNWIVLDDYHALAASVEAEAFIEGLIGSTTARVLVTSRRRPRWADARQILYGEVYELGPVPLAMNEEEAEKLLRHVSSDSARGLAALAHGWPAVLGLAAHSEYSALPQSDLPTALYEFFAEELYQSARPVVRQALVKLALIPTVDAEVTAEVLGAHEGDIVNEAIRLGFLVPTPGESVELHPLVREFLNRRPTPVDAPSSEEINEIVTALTERRRWDDAYAVAERAGTDETLVDLLRVAYRPLLGEGRLSTLTRWIEAARNRGLASPLIDLAEAEVAFRRGRDREAEALAGQAARRFELTDALRGRSFYIAGQAARLGDRPNESAENFRLAERFAGSQEDLREALWGQLSAHSGVSGDQAGEVLRKLERLEPSNANDVLRLATAYDVIDVRSGFGLERPLEVMAAAHPLALQADDPVVLTSFLNAYSRCLSMAAFYDDARRIADEETAAGIRYRLDFVLSPAYTARALAALGKGQFTKASKLLARSLALARDQDDTHNQFEVAAVRTRVLIAQQRFEEALQIKPPSAAEGVLVGMHGEWLGCRALALACSGEHRQAKRVADEASTVSSLEGSALSATARAILALDRNHTPRIEALSWLQQLIEWRYFDVFVLAVRARPALLEFLPFSSQASRPAADALRRADAHAFLPEGIEPSASEDDVLMSLSRREREVFELLGRGMTNREIAQCLYISEVTAKVHVRHILKKLGVRSRTEAALLGARDEPG